MRHNHSYLLGSPAKPTGNYVTTVQMRQTTREYGMRCRAAGNAKEKASKNIMRRCCQKTGKRSTYTTSVMWLLDRQKCHCVKDFVELPAKETDFQYPHTSARQM